MTDLTWDTEIPPKVPTRGYATPYREQKIVGHTTAGGRGKVARALKRRATEPKVRKLR